MSNSKLTREQKSERRQMLADLPRGSTIANDGAELVILCVPDGSVTRVFSSVKSADEKKFRRKVGEFHALARACYGDAGLLLPGYVNAQDFIDSIVNL